MLNEEKIWNLVDAKKMILSRFQTVSLKPPKHSIMNMPLLPNM